MEDKPSSRSVSISYDLGQHGWSRFDLSVGDRAVGIGPFGYCTDALGDLVRAALLLVTSAYSADVRFDGEPYEWRLCFSEGWKRKLCLRVEGDGEPLIEDHVTAEDFARAVQSAAQDIWDKLGADGYNSVWAGDRGFPLRALRALDAALSCDEPPPPNR